MTTIDRSAVLAAFDRQIRRQPTADPPDGWVERDDRVVRCGGRGWAGVTWSDLDDTTAEEAIAAQVDLTLDLPGRPGWSYAWSATGFVELATTTPFIYRNDAA